MFMLENFLLALAKLVNVTFTAYIWIVIGRAVISWVNADPYNPVVKFLIQATDPVLYKIRRHVKLIGGLDLSPVILILSLIFLQNFIVPTLFQIGEGDFSLLGVLGNFILSLVKLVNMAFSTYIFIVIGRAIISWVNADPYNPIVRFLVQATDPVLEKIRRYVPPMGGLDLSPMVLIFALIFLQSIIVPTLTQIGMSLH